MKNWMLQNQLILFAALSAIGFFILCFAYSRLQKKIKTLLGGIDSTNESFQHDLVRRLTQAELKLEELEPRLNLTEEISKVSVQKVGFLRFNPFQDTGGDNSFVVALLDRENNGIIISSFYSREGTRVYAKGIEQGLAKNPLSAEEKKVLEEVIRK